MNPYAWYRDTMLFFMHKVHRVAMDIMSCFAIGLGLPEDFYVKVCVTKYSLYRLSGLLPPKSGIPPCSMRLAGAQKLIVLRQHVLCLLCSSALHIVLMSSESLYACVPIPPVSV